MARPQKEGLDYFPLDVDFFSNRKIKALMGRFGAQGVTYYLYLLCEIYREHGYYLQTDDDFDYIISAELGIDPEKAGMILQFLLERSLFDRELFESEKVLTSASIQSRYQLAVKSRGSQREVGVHKRYWILPPEQTLSFIQCGSSSGDIPPQNEGFCEGNGDNFLKNDTKKRKENKTKENKSKQQQRKPDDGDVVVVDEREEILSCYEQNIGSISVAVISQLSDYLQNRGISSKLMHAVIEYSALYGAKSWRYLQTVLDHCLAKGITTPEQFEEDCQCRREQGKVSGDFAASAQRFSSGEGSFGSESSLDFAAIQEYISSGRGVDNPTSAKYSV